jgi:hypothetical protein
VRLPGEAGDFSLVKYFSRKAMNLGRTVFDKKSMMEVANGDECNDCAKEVAKINRISYLFWVRSAWKYSRWIIVGRTLRGSGTDSITAINAVAEVDVKVGRGQRTEGEEDDGLYANGFQSGTMECGFADEGTAKVDVAV